MGGSGLLRMSFRVDEEEEGVRTGDWLASRDAAFGEAVPSFESLFFLEDLLESLPRESFAHTQVSRTLGTMGRRDLRLWRRNASSLMTTASRLWGG